MMDPGHYIYREVRIASVGPKPLTIHTKSKGRSSASATLVYRLYKHNLRLASRGRAGFWLPFPRDNIEFDFVVPAPKIRLRRSPRLRDI
jgi:hypothetical protein